MQEKRGGADVLHKAGDQADRDGDNSSHPFFAGTSQTYDGRCYSLHHPGTVDAVAHDHDTDDGHNGIAGQAGKRLGRADQLQPAQQKQCQEGNDITTQNLGNKQKNGKRQYSEDENDFRLHMKKISYHIKIDKINQEYVRL